jgi:hypothetical protein
MGLLPPVILGALLIVAFALSSQQRLALAGHNAPLPARQIAYQMRVHHEAAIRLKQADPSLDAFVDALNDNDNQFLSCIQDKTVMTVMMIFPSSVPELVIGPSEVDAVVEELARQSVIAPELGRTGQTAWSNGNGGTLVAPVAGIGILDFPNIRTATGLMPTPPCLAPNGAPAIVTQVLP